MASSSTWSWLDSSSGSAGFVTAPEEPMVPLGGSKRRRKRTPVSSSVMPSKGRRRRAKRQVAREDVDAPVRRTSRRRRKRTSHGRSNRTGRRRHKHHKKEVSDDACAGGARDSAASETEPSASPAPVRPLHDPLAELDTEQRAAFDEVLARLPGACKEAGVAITDWVTDACVCRYLRARSYNPDKSLKMLVNSIVWRHEQGVDEITASQVYSEMVNEGKMYLSVGRDRDGRPIIYMKPRHDNTGAAERIIKVRYLVYLLELVSRACLDERYGEETMCWIIDFGGYKQLSGISQIRVSKDTAQVLANHYPERLGAVWMVNQPWTFNIFWGALRPFIDPKTKAKVRMLGSKYEPILEGVSPDNLEEMYGGSLEYAYDTEAFFEHCMALELENGGFGASRERL